MRATTLNVFGRREDWPRRREVLRAGFAKLEPDLVAFQEVIARPGEDQVAELLGASFELVHHGDREDDGEGISIASRWPVGATHEVDLHLGPRPAGFACAALVVEIAAPDPVGPLLFVNHLPEWQLTHEAERERQAVAVARRIDALAPGRHVILAGDMDATPDAASMRFWHGRQSLDGFSVCYRDAWSSCHPDEPGHTFTPDNDLVRTGDDGAWALELGRRIDHILVRCADHTPTLRIDACARTFDAPVDGVWGSDHFGVVADLSVP